MYATIESPIRTVNGKWLLAHTPEAPGLARRLVRAALPGWDLAEETVETAVLVVSELVTNAVVHAWGPLVLHLRPEPVHQRVWVGVSDGGPARRKGAWAASRAPEEHGRGLGVIESLALDHGTYTHDGGATHWACLNAAS